jgi:hypothetical protein
MAALGIFMKSILLSSCLVLTAVISSPAVAQSPDDGTKVGDTIYPTVWGYEFPWMKQHERGLQLDVQRAGANDFSVTYLTSLGVNNGQPHASFSGLMFFSGKPLGEKELGALLEKSGSRENNVLGDKIYVDRDSAWERKLTIDSCRSFSQFGMSRYQLAPRRLIEERSVLYYAEQPVHIYYDHAAYSRCITTGGWRDFPAKFYDARVFAVLPGLIPLEDSTFLLYDQLGNFIIRFDHELNSQSTLVNRTVFVVPTEDIVAIEDKLVGSKSFDAQTYDTAVATYLEQRKNRVPREAALREAIASIQ